MDGQSPFDPHSTLRYLIVRHVHALKGTCFGRVARSFFLHSGEMLPQVDCFFHNREAAEAFLAVLGVEHTVRLLEKQVFGTNAYRVTRTTAHGVECSVNVNVVAYHQGLGRRGRLPRNVPCPLFDIDCVFWTMGSVVSAVPPVLCGPEEARGDRRGLSHVLDRCMRRQFAVVSPLPRRLPEALLFLLEQAKELVQQGFVMDDSCDSRLPVVQRSNDPTFECAVLEQHAAFVVKLPCEHLVSHGGMVSVIRKRLQAARVECPVCGSVVCSRNPDAEAVL